MKNKIVVEFTHEELRVLGVLVHRAHSDYHKLQSHIVHDPDFKKEYKQVKRLIKIAHKFLHIVEQHNG